MNYRIAGARGGNGTRARNEASEKHAASDISAGFTSTFLESIFVLRKLVRDQLAAPNLRRGARSNSSDHAPHAVVTRLPALTTL